MLVQIGGQNRERERESVRFGLNDIELAPETSSSTFYVSFVTGKKSAGFLILWPLLIRRNTKRKFLNGRGKQAFMCATGLGERTVAAYVGLY